MFAFDIWSEKLFIRFFMRRRPYCTSLSFSLKDTLSFICSTDSFSISKAWYDPRFSFPPRTFVISSFMNFILPLIGCILGSLLSILVIALFSWFRVRTSSFVLSIYFNLSFWALVSLLNASLLALTFGRWAFWLCEGLRVRLGFNFSKGSCPFRV